MDLSKLWIEATATTIQNCFHQVGVNEMAAEAKQDDELAQEDEEMIQFAQEVVVEAPETVMENIPTYETLEGWLGRSRLISTTSWTRTWWGWARSLFAEAINLWRFERTSYAYRLCYN